MSQPNHVLLPHGGYEKLRSYRVATAVYDATVVFCERFFSVRDRTRDQMIQAARSGVRNISEGSGAAATSRRSEMRLTNVARASLGDELAADYRSFLTQRGLPVWDKDSPKARTMRQRLQQPGTRTAPERCAGILRLNGLMGLAQFVELAEPEVAANALLCATNQAAYLLKKQLEALERQFLVEGGFSERLYAARDASRRTRDSARDSSQETATPRGEKARPERVATPGSARERGRAGPDEFHPKCPVCGGPMRRRLARQGPHSGEEFWGCSHYPDCRGTLPD